MERLTTRNSEGMGVLKQPFECERCGDLQWSLPDLGMGSPIDRLAEYEDLEEQGKLLKLPCAVGDLVYSATKYNGVCEHEIRKFQFDKNGWCACSNLKFPISDFGRTVFLTREEAEAALKELEGKEE